MKHKNKFTLPLFWRYMVLLCLVALLFICALIITTSLSRKTLEKNFLEQTTELLQQNRIQFQESLQDTSFLIASIENSYYFAKIRYASDPLNLTQELYLSYIKNQLLEQTSLTQQFSDVFIYFPLFESGVDKYRTFRNTDEFSALYSLDDATYLPELCSAIPRPNTLYYLPAELYNIPSLSNMQRCIMILVKGNRSNYVFGFLYSTEKLNSIFKLSTLPEGSFLVVEDLAEKTVLYDGFEGSERSEEDYYYISNEIFGYKLRITLAIPNSYFSAQARSSQRIIFLLILAALLIGIAFCFGLSYIGALPAKKLMVEHNIAQADLKTNELSVISDYLSSISSSNAQMRELLIQNALVRLFAGGALTEDECTDLDINFAELSSPLILSIIQNQNDLSIIFLKSHFQTLLPALMCVQATPRSLCVILRHGDSARDFLADALNSINSSHSEQVRLICGLSLPFEGAGNIANAMSQAQMALPPHNAQIMRSFDELDSSLILHAQSRVFKLRTFQQELDYWHKNEVQDIIENYLQTANFAEEKPKEVFYTIRMLLNSAAASSGIELASRENLSYSYGLTPRENMAVLLNVIEELFEKHEALLRAQDKSIEERLLSYIHENISNPAFSIVDLASTCSLSERVINESIHNLTGKNFSKYFLELRMKKAADLLRSSEFSVKEISEMCGCPSPSTFFRNFKKYSSMTPLDYRDYYSGSKTPQ